MRVCLTVHGETPINLATSPIDRGGPSSASYTPASRRGGRTNAPGSRKNGHGWGGKWGGKRFPPPRAENPRKRAGLRILGTPAFGEEAELFSIREFGSLMFMVVSFGTGE